MPSSCLLKVEFTLDSVDAAKISASYERSGQNISTGDIVSRMLQVPLDVGNIEEITLVDLVNAEPVITHETEVCEKGGKRTTHQL